MDLSSVNYVGALSEGARLELRHPGTGKKFSAHGGQSLFVHVLGVDAPPVDEAKRAASRALMRMSKDDGIAQATKFEIEIACAAVVSFEGGTGSVSSLDEFKGFLRTHPDGKYFARQVLNFAENTANFFEVPPAS